MSSQNIVPPLSAVDVLNPTMALGTIVEDSKGAEYIYLQGVALTALGSCVSYNPSTYATTLGAGTAAGRLAFAMGPVVAQCYGWYLIKGEGPCVTAGTTVAGAAAFLAAGGTVDDAVVATDRIENAYFLTTTTPAGRISVIYPQAIGLG